MSRSGLDRSEAKRLQEVSDRLRADLKKRRKEARELRQAAEQAEEAAAAAAEAAAAATPDGVRLFPTPSTSGGRPQASADLGETEGGADGTESADAEGSEPSVSSAGTSRAPSRATSTPGSTSGGDETGGDIATTGGGGEGGSAPPPPRAMVNYADSNEADTDDVCTRADGIKVPYDKQDPVYWFRRLEIQMQLRKIKSQFWKQVVLEQNLPAEIIAPSRTC